MLALVKVARRGNSNFVRIPALAMPVLGWETGTIVSLDLADGGLLVRTAAAPPPGMRKKKPKPGDPGSPAGG